MKQGETGVARDGPVRTHSDGASGYKKSIRQFARETGHTRQTVRKALQRLSPKYRRKEDPACAVMDSVGVVKSRNGARSPHLSRNLTPEHSTIDS